ncbi:hypothetical protein BN1095_5970001 [Clostridioides difficile]|uniref:Uncharacterized protein n=1 Tax=Clostridioides difficile TaxID=1496 RepID=A0A069ASU6_CLODI|nr:hypothetical protein BN1095_5970001 [Clostridioides difficile]
MPSEHASDGISIRSANYITSARRLTSLATTFQQKLPPANQCAGSGFASPDISLR